MKKITYLITFAAILGLSACDKDEIKSEDVQAEKTERNEGDIQVPTAVATSFSREFPQAKDVEWEMEGTVYEVEFELGQTEHEAAYAETGTLLELETKLKETSQIPATALTYITANYPNADIEEAAMKEINGKGTFYEVVIELENDEEEDDDDIEQEGENEDGDEEGDDDDETVLELVFDESGNFVSVEQEDREDDDDEEGDDDDDYEEENEEEGGN